MLTALDFLRPVGRGVTAPQLFRADDGKIYVVKLQNNRLGPKILANELLGAKFGEMLGLCFPPAEIIKISQAFLQRNRWLIRAGVRPGRHFACQFLSGASYLNPRNLFKAANKAEMAGVMLFDNLLHNFDRTLNRRNLLLRREGQGYRIYAIDNSHLFRRGVWTKELLEKLTPQIKINRYRSYGTLLRHCLQPDYFDDYVKKIMDLSDDCLAKTVADIPDEWLPQASDRQALLKFLTTRRDMVAEIATCICALIPDKHRSADLDKGE